MEPQEVETLKKFGKEWTKGDMHRIYFNDLSAWYGLKCEYYNTGNVNHAWLDGDRISNSEARRIMGRLTYSKVWYDVTADKFFGKDIQTADFNVIVAAIKAAAANSEPHPALEVAA